MEWLQSVIELIKGYKKPTTVAPSTKKPATVAPTTVPPLQGHFYLFDLPEVYKVLSAEGLPGSEGELLYVLGQVANGWGIGQGEGHPILVEYANDEVLRGRVEDWYEAKMVEASNNLKAGMSCTVILNDAKDRFGCRIGPPSYSRLNRLYGDKVELGDIIPEADYE